MYQIDIASAVSVRPGATATGTAGWFTDGDPLNPGGAIPGTVLPAEWLNMVMAELDGVALLRGGSLDKTVSTQLAQNLNGTRAVDAYTTDMGSTTRTSYAGGVLIAVSTSRVNGAHSGCVCIATSASYNQGSESILGAGVSLSNSGLHNVAFATDTFTITGDECAAIACNTGAMGGTNNAHIASTGCASDNSSNLAFYQLFAASDACTSTQMHTAAIASSNCTQTVSAKSIALASDGVELQAGYTGSLACNGGKVDKTCSAVIASAGGAAQSEVRKPVSAAIATSNTTISQGAAGGSSVALAAKYVEITGDYIVAGGKKTGVTSLTPGGVSEQNQTWRINGNTGVFYGNTFDTGGADYAEYFENLTIGVIPIGVAIALEGDKIRPATEGDVTLGIVSNKPGVTGNTAALDWEGRWLRDVWDNVITDPTLWIEVEGQKIVSEPDPVTGAVTVTWDPGYEGPFDRCPEHLQGKAAPRMLDIPRVNPVWDPSRVYVPRSERPSEYTRVALLGQVRARVAGNVTPGAYLKPSPGGLCLSGSPTNLRALRECGTDGVSPVWLVYVTPAA